MAIFWNQPSIPAQKNLSSTAPVRVPEGGRGYEAVGRYLYRAHLDFGKGLTHLFLPLGNIAIRNGLLHAVCVREDDTVVLVKYKVALPRDGRVSASEGSCNG